MLDKRIMKKTLALGLTGIMMVTMLAGCGAKSGSETAKIQYEEYVTLCDYKGIPATKVVYDVSDEEIQNAIQENMTEYATYEPITDRSAQNGDWITVTYTTKIDGKEYEDYSSEEDSILLGEGELFPEVEAAIIGMNAGDKKEVDVNLTDEYVDEEDVGKQANVSLELKELSQEIYPEYNEDFVKENTDYATTEEYEESLKEELLADKEYEYRNASLSDIMDYLLANCTFNGYPDELYQECEESYNSENEDIANMLQMDLEEWEDFQGIDEESKKQEIQDMVNMELVIGAIANKENIKCTEDEIQQFAEENYEDYESDSVEDFIEEAGKDNIESQIIYDKVIDVLYDNAQFTEISEEEYKEQQGDDELEDEDSDIDVEENSDSDSDAEESDSQENNDADSEEDTNAEENNDSQEQ